MEQAAVATFYGKNSMCSPKHSCPRRTRVQMGVWAENVNVRRCRLFVAIMSLGLALFGTITGALAQSLPASANQPTTSKPIKLVAFGDSLSAGYQLAPSEAFPVVLGKALAARGHNVEVINAAVSGDTTSAGRERIAWAVPPDADAIILEFGGNDALRGLDPAAAKTNLEAMIQTFQAQKADILIAGMLAPRSLGDAYTKAFDGIFPDLAAKYGLLLYPFFLEKTALQPRLSLSDGLHPNAKGVEAVVSDILPKVEDLLDKVRARRAVAAPKG